MSTSITQKALIQAFRDMAKRVRSWARGGATHASPAGLTARLLRPAPAPARQMPSGA